jgi:hypothetical protein
MSASSDGGSEEEGSDDDSEEEEEEGGDAGPAGFTDENQAWLKPKAKKVMNGCVSVFLGCSGKAMCWFDLGWNLLTASRFDTHSGTAAGGRRGEAAAPVLR